MIWPFKKKMADNTKSAEPFTSVFYIRDGVKWKYLPAKDITAYEAAMIAPAFLNPFARLDYIAYFEKHNLMRHFIKQEP